MRNVYYDQGYDRYSHVYCLSLNTPEAGESLKVTDSRLAWRDIPLILWSRRTWSEQAAKGSTTTYNHLIFLIILLSACLPSHPAKLILYLYWRDLHLAI